MGIAGWGRFACAALAGVVVALAAAAAPAEIASPTAFLDGIYKSYLGKNSRGVALDNEAQIRRYFAPPLSDAMVKDFAEAQKANEVPMLGGDPFIDAQDWEVSNLKIGVKMIGADQAVGTVVFRLFKEMRTVTVDLVRVTPGWRISDIKAPSGSLRELYKLQ